MPDPQAHLPRSIAFLGAAALIALAGLNVAMALPGLIHAGSAGRTDFSSFYLAGRTLVDHQSRHLYEYGAQLRFQRQLFSSPNPALPFIHPAYEALLFAPLSLLPLATSVLTWVLLNLLMLVMIGELLRPYLGAALRRFQTAVFCLALAFAPVGVSFMMGQDTILQLLFFTLAFVSLKQRRDFRAGCYLALALIKWQLVLPVVLVLFLQREWKAVRGFLAAAVVLAAVSLAIVGPGGVMPYVQLIRFTAAIDTVVAMPTLRGAFAYLLPWPFVVRLLTVAGTIALLAMPVTTGADLRARGAAFDLNFSLTLTVTLLVAYHLYLSDLTLLLLPLLLLAGFYLDHQQFALPLALCSFLLIQVFIYFADWRQLAPLAIPMLAFAGLLWWEIRKLGKRPGPDQWRGKSKDAPALVVAT